MQVDLPALERPTKAISGMSSSGTWSSCAAVVKNRAVCSQPIGVTGLAGAGAAAGALAAVERLGLAGGRLEGDIV